MNGAQALGRRAAGPLASVEANRILSSSSSCIMACKGARVGDDDDDEENGRRGGKAASCKNVLRSFSEAHKEIANGRGKSIHRFAV